MSLYAVPYVVQPLLAVVQAVCCAALASSVLASRFLVCGIMWRLWSSAAYVQWATSDIGEQCISGKQKFVPLERCTACLLAQDV